MVTCILRDLLLLQKVLLFCSKDTPQQAAATEAYAAKTLFLLIILASKLHEAISFFRKQNILEEVATGLEPWRDKVYEFSNDQEIRRLLGFIRNKFGFHYDTQENLDRKLDDAFQQLGELEMWVSLDNAGNDIFTSTNRAISEVIYGEAQRLGFTGDKKDFTEHLHAVILQGCKVVANFGRRYLASGFCVAWNKVELVELQVPVVEDVFFPSLIARGS